MASKTFVIIFGTKGLPFFLGKRTSRLSFSGTPCGLTPDSRLLSGISSKVTFTRSLSFFTLAIFSVSFFSRFRCSPSVAAMPTAIFQTVLGHGVFVKLAQRQKATFISFRVLTIRLTTQLFAGERYRAFKFFGSVILFAPATFAVRRVTALGSFHNIKVVQRLGVRARATCISTVFNTLGNLFSSFKKLIIGLFIYSRTVLALRFSLVFSVFASAKLRKGQRAVKAHIGVVAIRSATLLSISHLASFKRKIKPLIVSVRRTPIASSDLDNEGLDSYNNLLMSVKQKSLFAIGTSYYTRFGVVLPEKKPA